MDRRHTLRAGKTTIALTDEELEHLVTRRPITIEPETLSQRVLAAVCESGPYVSSVTLAADLYRGPGDAVSAEIVQWALEALNEQGRVVYSLVESGYTRLYSHGLGTDTVVSSGMFVRIRATEQGFKDAGFPPPTHVAGNRKGAYRADQAIHPADATDFRNMSFKPPGGPIVVDDIFAHMRRFPTHRHEPLEVSVRNALKRRLARLTGQQQRQLGWKPVFVAADDPIQPTMVEEVAAQIQAEAIRRGNNFRDPTAIPPSPVTTIEGEELPMMTVEQIMKERGISKRQAYKHIYQENAAKWGTGPIPFNQKAMALEALNLIGKATDMTTLQGIMAKQGFSMDTHSLTHVVWSLQKQGLIKFREQKNSSKDSGAKLVAVRLLPAGVSQLQANRAKADGVKLDAPIKDVPPARKDHPEGIKPGTRHARDRAKLANLVAEAIEDEAIEQEPTSDRDAATRWREQRKGDMTRPERHKTQAQGGPIEHAKIDTSTLPDIVAERVPDQLKTEPSPVTEQAGEVTSPAGEREAQVSEREAQAPQVDTHTEYSVTNIAFQMDSFPLISALGDRKRKVEAAAELLMDAGQEELALTALGSVKYTSLEEEVLRLLKTLG